jgi:hypothetical protein
MSKEPIATEELKELGIQLFENRTKPDAALKLVQQLLKI